MSKLPETNESQDSAVGAADQTRRKLTSAGLAGAGVLLSVASRSAMGGWGQCTGSELASGNLSRTGTPNPCGCSPGYWWNSNGLQTWDTYLAATYPKTKGFNQVFGRTFFNPDVQLQNCGPGTHHTVATALSSCNGSVMDAVAMHAVAALFNAAFYGTRYPVLGLQTPAAVISAFQAAFDSPNNCADLIAFKNRVDIYTSSNTWCDAKPHGGS